MQSGNLDRLVTIYQSSLAQNTQGEMIRTWSVLCTIWAVKLVPPTSGREVATVQGISAQTFVRFRCRYRNDILPTHRLITEGVSYNINTVTEIGRKDQIELSVTSVDL